MKNKIKKHNIKGDIMYYIKYFFITSILGFFLEEIICKNYQSGILNGPWTPIYGIGSIIIIYISDKILKKKNIGITKKFVIVFISCTLLLSLGELIGGLAIEKIFKITFWDYTNYKYNIGKYICLEMSLIWGLTSIIFICILRPTIDVIIKKIPNIIIYILSILFIIDTILTILKRV